MSATVYGNGNVSVGATGSAVHRGNGAHFKTLSPDAINDRVSSWWLGDAQKTVTATAQKTITTKEESDVGAYKVTGTGYYKQSTGGDGLELQYDRLGVAVSISGIDSETLSLPLEDNIPTFDIAVQCDPAEACSESGPGCANDADNDWCDDEGTCSVGSDSGVPGPECGHNWCCCDPPSGSTPPSSGSTPPTSSGSTPPADPLSNHPGCATDVLYDQCNDGGSCSEAESSDPGVASSRCGEKHCCCYFWN